MSCQPQSGRQGRKPHFATLRTAPFCLASACLPSPCTIAGLGPPPLHCRPRSTPRASGPRAVSGGSLVRPARRPVPSSAWNVSPGLSLPGFEPWLHRLPPESFSSTLLSLDGSWLHTGGGERENEALPGKHPAHTQCSDSLAPDPTAQ